MTKRIHKQLERYTSYKTEQLADGQYRITVFYFVDKGNPIQNIKMKNVKYIKCSEQDLHVKTREISNDIIKTKYRLIRALHYMGASELNVNAFIKQNIQNTK